MATYSFSQLFTSISVRTFAHNHKTNEDILVVFTTELTICVQNSMETQKVLDVHNNSIYAPYVISVVLKNKLSTLALIECGWCLLSPPYMGQYHGMW